MGQGQRILEGIRVVEAASFIFGPAAGTVMSDFGADVVHIENPGMGDPHRYLPFLKPLPECEQNYCWMLDARNKKSLAMDLKSPDGREAAYRLVKQADVFITNYRPVVLEKFGLRYADLEPLNSRLIYAHATGYGEVGAEINKPGYDATAWWARSGLMDVVRPGDGGMGLATPGMGDHPSAMALFGGIMLALYQRERTGRGTKVSSSLLGNGAWSNSILVQAALCGAPFTAPPVRSDPPNALVNHYRTADGRALYLAMVQEAPEWGRFCDAIGRPELREDPRFVELPDRRAHARELTEILDATFAAKPAEEWQAVLDEHKITFSVIARLEEMAEDEQMLANGVLRGFADAENSAWLTVDSPINLAGAEKVAPTRAPEIGEHSVEILEGLGYSSEEIARLCESGVVRTA